MLTRRDMLHRMGAAGVSAAALQTGIAATAMPSERTAPDFQVPPGACDCHVHVFGDPAKFPFAAKRIYTSPGASVEELLQLQKSLNLDRVVWCSRASTRPTIPAPSMRCATWARARAA